MIAAVAPITARLCILTMTGPSGNMPASIGSRREPLRAERREPEPGHREMHADGGDEQDSTLASASGWKASR